jgi:hypothetical protein
VSAGLGRAILALRGSSGVPGQGLATLPTQLGALTPRTSPLSLEETAWMLQGLFLANKSQLARGVAGIDRALKSGRVVYIRDDPDEIWQTITSIWSNGGGDCEDLAAAVAAELDTQGIAARPVIYRVRPGLAHAVVQLLDPRYRNVRGVLFGHPVIAPGILDPSRTGGMGRGR